MTDLKKALAKVKEDGPDPTPGYIFDKLSSSTFEGQKEMMKLVEAFLKNLGSSSPYVLQKTLKAIRMTCEKGHPSFKKEMQGHVEKLRTAAGFRGKSDPVHGDSLNQGVRDAAQSAIEAAFAATKTVNTAQSGDYKGSAGGTTAPVGPSPTFTTGNQIAASSIASSGFGSQSGMTAAPAPSSGILGEFKSALGSGFGMKEVSETERIMKQLQADQQAGGLSSYTPPTSITAPTFQPVSLHGELTPQSQKWGKDTGFKAPEAVDTQEVEQLSAEQQLVESLIKANKQSATPTRTQLSTFVTQAQRMGLSELCEALDDHLEAKQAWQVRTTALCAIEALIQANLQAAREYFTQHPEDVVRNVSVVQASLKEKAMKVLSLLGLQDLAEKSPRAQQKADIFNQMQQGAAPAPTQASPTAGGGGFDMAGMVVKDRPAAAGSPAGVAGLGPASPTSTGKAEKEKGLRTRKSRAPAAAAPADFSLVGGSPAVAPATSNGSFGTDSAFGFLGTPSASPVAAASTPQATTAASPTVQKPAASNDLDDLFGVSSSPAPAQPAMSSQAPGASAFSFLTPAAPPAAPVQPTTAAADPLAAFLSNPTPAPAAGMPMNMANVTPQQMQAQMAQMMMMMQQMGMQPGMMPMMGMQPGMGMPGVQPGGFGGVMGVQPGAAQPQPAATNAFDFLAQEMNAMKK